MKKSLREALQLIGIAWLAGGCAAFGPRNLQPPHDRGAPPHLDQQLHLSPAGPAVSIAFSEYAEMAGRIGTGQMDSERVVASVLHALPEIPSVELDSRCTSAESTTLIDGASEFSSSSNASESGSSLSLVAEPQGVSWAVYQLPELGGGEEVTALLVESSGHAFSGRTPGIWLCIANYETGLWELVSRIGTVSYSRVMSETIPYLSPDGHVYIGLVVTEGQAASIDQVGLRVDRDWTEVPLADVGDVGISPAVVLDKYASIHVAYSDNPQGNPQYAICLGNKDPLVKSNWAFSLVDTASPGVARGLDIVIDQTYERPAVSYVYEGLSESAGNSQVVLACLVDHPTQGLVWANYTFSADGANYSSLDWNPVDGAFAFAACVDNANTPASNAYDIEYRYWDLNKPWDPTDNGEVTRTTGYGSGYYFPHLRLNPSAGNAAICADGGFLLYENGPEDWLQAYERPEAGDFGSLAYVPGGVVSTVMLGMSYSEVQGEEEKLIYVSADGSLIGVPEVVESIATQGGAWIGGRSQLAYTREGDPVIAYTAYDGQAVEVRVAQKSGGIWKVETVSVDAGDASSRDAVEIDLAVEPPALAFDPLGRVAVVFNRVTGGQNALILAIKDSLSGV